MTESQKRWHLYEYTRLQLIEDRKKRLFLMKKHDIRVITQDGLIGVFMGRRSLAFFGDAENERELYIRQLIYAVTMALDIKERSNK